MGDRIFQGAPGNRVANQCSPAVGCHYFQSREFNLASETVTEVVFSPPWPCLVQAVRLIPTTKPSAGATPASVSVGVAGKGTTDDADRIVAGVNVDLGGFKQTGFAQWLTVIKTVDTTLGRELNHLKLQTNLHPEALTVSVTAGTGSGKGFFQFEIEPASNIQNLWAEEWTTTTTTTTTTTSTTP